VCDGKVPDGKVSSRSLGNFSADETETPSANESWSLSVFDTPCRLTRGARPRRTRESAYSSFLGRATQRAVRRSKRRCPARLAPVEPPRARQNDIPARLRLYSAIEGHETAGAAGRHHPAMESAFPQLGWKGAVWSICFLLPSSSAPISGRRKSKSPRPAYRQGPPRGDLERQALKHLAPFARVLHRESNRVGRKCAAFPIVGDKPARCGVGLYSSLFPKQRAKSKRPSITSCEGAVHLGAAFMVELRVHTFTHRPGLASEYCHPHRDANSRPRLLPTPKWDESTRSSPRPDDPSSHAMEKAIKL